MLAGADGPVVVLSGEADTTTATVLREMLAALLDTGARLVTIEAAGLSFLDSASMRVLVLAARALKGRHGRLVLARPQRQWPGCWKSLARTGCSTYGSKPGGHAASDGEPGRVRTPNRLPAGTSSAADKHSGRSSRTAIR